jgi:hypothetical protein
MSDLSTNSMDAHIQHQHKNEAIIIEIHPTNSLSWCLLTFLSYVDCPWNYISWARVWNLQHLDMVWWCSRCEFQHKNELILKTVARSRIWNKVCGRWYCGSGSYMSQHCVCCLEVEDGRVNVKEGRGMESRDRDCGKEEHRTSACAIFMFMFMFLFMVVFSSQTRVGTRRHLQRIISWWCECK